MKYLAIILALASTCAGLAAAFLARPLTPSYLKRLREVSRVLERAVSALGRFASYLRDAVDRNGGIPGSLEEPSVGLSASLTGLDESLKKATQEIHVAAIWESQEEVRSSGYVRVLGILAAVLASSSATLRCVRDDDSVTRLCTEAMARQEMVSGRATSPQARYVPNSHNSVETY
jgi:hypothetical protein